jgi:CRISPR system Cascade subunit CasD
MATLLLRLAAPLQSWGADSKFETRKTSREPTKSGVTGLLAAAIGLRRDQTSELEVLSKLRFGVRVEREGQLLVDFHTSRSSDTSYITYRHYLQDAVFLVGLESDDTAFLDTLADAVTHPAYPLFLGRRSCPPTLPVCLGVRDSRLRETLEREPQLCFSKDGGHRFVLDADPEDPKAGLQRDVPVSFDPRHRQYGYRSVREYSFGRKTDIQDMTEHDPFAEL